MAKGPRANPDKARRWRYLLDQWRRSGLNVRDFCFEHQLSVPSFYFWRRRLPELQATTSKPIEPIQAHSTAFIPVSIVDPPLTASKPVEIVLGNGRVLRVGHGVQRELLLQVIETLEAKPC